MACVSIRLVELCRTIEFQFCSWEKCGLGISNQNDEGVLRDETEGSGDKVGGAHFGKSETHVNEGFSVFRKSGSTSASAKSLRNICLVLLELVKICIKNGASGNLL